LIKSDPNILLSPQRGVGGGQGGSGNNSNGGASNNSVGDEVVQSVDIDAVKCGDICKVLPGTGIPTDGVITAGASFVDESMITGNRTQSFIRFSSYHLKLFAKFIQCVLT
jgi:hypothetical protein